MVLLDEGTRSGKLYILIEGEVQILRGDVEVATVSEPGSVFGEMSILLDVPHTASVKTLAPTPRLLRGERRDVPQLVAARCCATSGGCWRSACNRRPATSPT